eukprot:TRINITY_DN8128_c0_g1_i1.p1 TRINITY_DN8128_c0_g1~~TRINITY_DN8128_c0_g1_i1.p1  ORF type:complete len:1691 (+),score=598.38 TRINITY_DN8128_c0_g1_i1:44-5074(+)
MPVANHAGGQPAAGRRSQGSPKRPRAAGSVTPPATPERKQKKGQDSAKSPPPAKRRRKQVDIRVGQTYQCAAAQVPSFARPCEPGAEPGGYVTGKVMVVEVTERGGVQWCKLASGGWILPIMDGKECLRPAPPSTPTGGKKRSRQSAEAASPARPPLPPRKRASSVDDVFDYLSKFLERPEGAPTVHSPREVEDCAAALVDYETAQQSAKARQLTESELPVLLDAASELAESASLESAGVVCQAVGRMLNVTHDVMEPEDSVRLLRCLLPLVVSTERDAAHAVIGSIFRLFSRCRPSHVDAVLDHFLSPGDARVLHLGAVLVSVVHAAVPLPAAFSDESETPEAAEIRVQRLAQELCVELLGRTVDDESMPQQQAVALLGHVVDELLQLAVQPKHCAADLILYRLLWTVISKYIRSEERTDRGLAAAVEVIGKCAHRNRLVAEHADAVDVPPKPRWWYVPPAGVVSHDDMKQKLDEMEPLDKCKVPELRELGMSFGLLTVPRAKGDLIGALRKHVDSMDLASKSRPELAEVARELGIKGASAMKKDELKAAVAAKQRGAGEDQTLKGIAAVSLPAELEGVYAGCLDAVGPYVGARQFFLLQWIKDFNVQAAAAQRGLKGAAARSAVHAKDHRLRWISKVLATEPEASEDRLHRPSQNPSQQVSRDHYTYYLSKRPKSVLSTYSLLVAHLVQLFGLESTPPHVKRQVTSHISALMEVDPSIVESIWPAVAKGLRDEGSAAVTRESLLEIVALVLERVDRFDAHFEKGWKSGEMVHKMLALVRNHVGSRSVLVAKKALRVLWPILQSPHVADALRIRMCGYLLRNYSNVLPQARQEVINVVRKAFTFTPDGKGQGDTAPAVVAHRIAQWVADEVVGSPVLEFPTGHATHPSWLVECTTALLSGHHTGDPERKRKTKDDGKGKAGRAKDAEVSGAEPLACAAGVVSEWLRCASSKGKAQTKAGLALCCLHLTALSAPKLLAACNLKSLVGFLRPPSGDASDDEISVFLHSCRVSAATGTLYKLPVKEAAAALDPLFEAIKKYAGRHTQRVIAAAVAAIGSSCGALARGSKPQPGHLKTTYQCLAKSCHTLRTVYVPLLRQQPDKQAKVVPPLLRTVFIVGSLLQTADWSRRDVQDVCAKVPAESNLYAGTDDAYAHVYKTILVPLMGVVVSGQTLEDLSRDRIVSVLLRVVSVLCMRDPHVYFPCCKALILVAIRKKQGMLAEVQCAGLEVIRDFLVDEEERIEAAHTASPSQGEDENSGMATTLMADFLKPILVCLHSDNAAVRFTAMDVTEVCYKQGLSLPMLAMEDLVGAAVADGDLRLRAIAVLDGFSNKQAANLIPRVPGGVASGFAVCCSRQSPASVRGCSGLEMGSPVSVLDFAHRNVASLHGGKVSLCRELLGMLQRQPVVDAWTAKVGYAKGAAFHFVRFLVEAVAFLPFTREAEVHASIGGVDKLVSLAEEETLAELTKLVGDGEDQPGAKKGGRAASKSPKLPCPEKLAPLMLRAWCMVCALELKGMLKKDFGITARRLEAVKRELAAGADKGGKKEGGLARRRGAELAELSQPAQDFLENTSCVADLYSESDDGGVHFTAAQISDLRDLLSRTIMAEANELWSEERAVKELRGKLKKSRKRKAESSDGEEGEEAEEEEDDDSDSSSSAEAKPAKPAAKAGAKKSARK